MAEQHTDSEKGTTATPGASIAAEQTEQHKKRLLAAFEECGCVSHAAKAAGIGRTTHYLWLRTDRKYAEAWAMARAAAVDLLADEAKRRAVDGTPCVTFYRGKPLIDPGTGGPYVENTYSDKLLIFLLKSWDPVTYGDKAMGHRQTNVNVVQTAPAAAPDPRDVGLVPEQREVMHKLRAMMEDEGLMPGRRRRLTPAAEDAQPKPEQWSSHDTEAEQHVQHDPMRGDHPVCRSGHPPHGRADGA